jgi:hypothetical protein
MSNPEDKIIEQGTAGLDSFGVSPGLRGDSSLSALLSREEAKQASGFKLPMKEKSTTTEAAKVAATVVASQTPEAEEKATDARIQALEKQLAELVKGKHGVRVGPAQQKKEVDFTKLSESDVFNLEIPIDAIEHQVPDYTKVELLDQNYIPRWVQVHPARLGPMRAAGFEYVTQEDLAEQLILDLREDENGQFRFIDLVLMKCRKDKYFGALRKNYERAIAQTNPAKLHQKAKQGVEGMLANEKDDQGNSHKRDFQKYSAEGKMEVYI